MVRVTSSARNTPTVDSSADAMTAIGAAKPPNSNSSTVKTSSTASTSTSSRSWNDRCCSSYAPPYATRIAAGRCRSAIACCTAATPVPRSTPSSRAVTVTLRCRFSRRTSVWPGISSTVASVPSVPVWPVSADEQRVPDRVHGRARRTRKPDADRVGAIVHDDRRRRRLALHDGAGVDLDFLRREPGARRHRLIHLEHRRRTADRVLDAVEHVDDAGHLLDRLADLRRPPAEQRRILREQLDRDRLRARSSGRRSCPAGAG